MASVTQYHKQIARSPQ